MPEQSDAEKQAAEEKAAEQEAARKAIEALHREQGISQNG